MDEDRRWDDVTADLAAEFAGLLDDARDADAEQLAEAELAALPLAARFRAAVGQDLVVGVAAVGPVTGRLRRAAPQCLVLTTAAGGEVVVPAGAVVWVRGLGAAAVPYRDEEPVARLGLGAELRALARHGTEVTLTLTDGTDVRGRLDRVGRDWLDVTAEGAGTRVVTFAAIALVQG